MNSEKDFTEVYHTHAPKVFRLCMGYASGDEDLAKEWLQETFIKVWKHRKTFRKEANAGTWIYRIAVNVCLSDLRKTQNSQSIQEHMMASEIADSEEINQEDNIHKLYGCIDQLTAQNKALILLELEEVPQATIAETVGLAHGAVRTRLSRIRNALLKCMTYEK